MNALTTAAYAAVFPNDANWRRIDYLAGGNARQRSAFAALSDSGLWPRLQACGDCALVSTVAIGLDVASSDLDILCHGDPTHFAAALDSFFIYQSHDHPSGATVLRGALDRWPIELFITQKPLELCHSWRHLGIMARLLTLFGPRFGERLTALRCQGLKGEAAMAHTLALEGDPYAALLTLEHRTDADLLALWTP